MQFSLDNEVFWIWIWIYSQKMDEWQVLVDALFLMKG
jgi:hypothetical protein